MDGHAEEALNVGRFSRGTASPPSLFSQVRLLPQLRRVSGPWREMARSPPTSHHLRQLEGQEGDSPTNNQARMKYVDGEQRAEPPGSGAIESTCRQQQCRMKRCGQF